MLSAARGAAARMMSRTCFRRCRVSAGRPAKYARTCAASLALFFGLFFAPGDDFTSHLPTNSAPLVDADRNRCELRLDVDDAVLAIFLLAVGGHHPEEVDRSAWCSHVGMIAGRHQRDVAFADDRRELGL